MKKLILPLILLSSLVHAEVQEMNTDIKKKFLSVVKDVEVEKRLGASAEFNDCRKDSVFLATDTTDAQKNAKLEKAAECFKKKLAGKPEAELKKLSASLGLESYGLVKSNNVNEVTAYLQKKMTISLTGKDPDEKDPKKIMEQMKWKNQKIVDQKVFIDLYKNQLMKNALFELSRYCFESLRILGSSEPNFATHWALKNMQSVTNNGKQSYVATSAVIDKLTDDGNPPFFKLDKAVDTTDKEAVYKGIVENLSNGSAIDPVQYEAYFSYCTSALPLLCNQYKDSLTSVQNKTNSSATTLTRGSTSCLVMDRLRNIREAMGKTDKVAKQFEELGDKDTSVAIQMLEDPTFYERGNNKGEASLDELTSMSSADMLANSEKNEDLSKLDCRAGKDKTACEDYLVENDGLDKTLNSIEIEMTLKRETELEQVRKLKVPGKEKELKEYLTENGMFELLNKIEANEPGFDIEDEIRKIYDARKVAMTEGLKVKVGKRQISEKNTKSDSDKDDMRAENVQDSREEKARLAQVVMFNNIITSQLSLTDKDGKDLGRNVTAWNQELKGITSASGYKADEKLFKGLQDNAKGAKKIDNASLVDGGIIDTILGKKP